jgi:hypothetical protein
VDFADEPYVRKYTRKTLTSRLLGWEGRAVVDAMLGEFDHSGVFDFRGDVVRAIWAVTDIPEDIVRLALERLIETETWVVNERSIVWPTLPEAQGCVRNDRLRQQASRAQRNANSVTRGHRPSQPVTAGHTPSRPPESSHTESQPVTSSHGPSREPENGHTPSQPVTVGHSESQPVTASHTESQPVTASHGPSQPVTLRSALLPSSASQALLSQAADPERAREAPPQPPSQPWVEPRAVHGESERICHDLDDWVMPASFPDEARMAGVLDFEDRLAKLRLGPIGGKRGVFVSRRDDYVRQQFADWRTWGETERAKAAAQAQSPPFRLRACPTDPNDRLRVQAERIRMLEAQEAAEEARTAGGP